MKKRWALLLSVLLLALLPLAPLPVSLASGVVVVASMAVACCSACKVSAA